MDDVSAPPSRPDVSPILEAPDAHGDPADLMSLTVERYAGAIAVVVGGEIDLSTAARLNEVLTAQIGAGPEVLVVDLDEVLFFTTVGLTAVALAQRAAQERGVDYRVVATTRATLRPLQITGMADDLALYPSRAAALAGLTVDDGETAALPAL